MQKLSNSIQLAHCLLKNRLNEAKIIVDATAGNGNDTLFLAQNTLNNAQIYAFDIQKEAIENTKALLIKNKDNINLPLENISFIHDSHEHIDNYIQTKISHEHIDNYIQTKIDIAIFNLGYLPGGDHKFTTKDDTTLKAIDKILNNLNINGYVAIVMYPGHEEGLKEYQSIKLFVKDLPKKSFTVGWYKMINHNFNAPALCWIEKVGEYA